MVVDKQAGESSVDPLDAVANNLYGETENDQGPDYQRIAGELKEQGVSKLRSSLSVAADRNPDHFGRVNQIAQKYKTSPDFVAENESEFAKKSKLDDVDYETLLKDQHLSKFLQDPNNATLAQDDIENLTGLTKAVENRSLMSDLGDAFLSGTAGFWGRMAKVPAYAYDVAALPQNIFYNLIGSERRVKSPDWLRDNPISQRYDEGAKSYAAQVEGLNDSAFESIKGGDYTKAGRIIALQVMANAPQQVANIGTAMVNPAAGVALAFGGSAAGKNDDNLDNNIDPITSTLNATITGGGEALFEKLGTFGLLDKISAQVTKEFGEATAREILKSTGKALGTAFVGEGTEEALTAIGEGLADKHMGVSPDLTYGQIFSNSVDSFLIGGFSGFSMTGPTAVLDGSLQIRARLQRNTDLEFYRSLGDAAQVSKLAERSPEKFSEVVKSITAGTPVETAYMPVEDVDQYFQTKQINPAKFMQEIGLLEQYEQAKQTGGEMSIPLAQWVEKVGKSEHFRGLENHVKFNMDALTKGQEIRERAKMNRLFEEAEAKANEALGSEETRQAQMEIETQIEGIRKSLGDQLMKTGKYTNELVKDQVELIVRPLRYFAQANGKKPLEYFNEINLNIRNGGQYTPDIDRQSDQIFGELSDLVAQPAGIPSHDDAGNRIFDDGVVSALKLSIEKAEAGKRVSQTNADGEVVGTVAQESSFPEFFKNKGYTKKESLKIIQKHLDGKTLSEKEQAMFNDLYDGALDKTNRGGFFQKIKNTMVDRESDHQARVVFGKSSISIDLFKGSDPTSLMHEMGHVYLEMFKTTAGKENAPEWLKQDADKVLKYLGVESFKDIKTEHHELWARSIEKYLYEGKAPNDELVSTFARLKMWFRKVYTDVKSALGVELNDEIRDVMDRVFAGDYLTANIEKQFKPLFGDSIIRGLSKEEQAKYLSALGRSRAAATETVQKKLMEHYTKERRKWYNDQLKKHTEIFKKELSKRREYVAQRYIKEGILPNGTEAVGDERAHKLSKESLVAAFGRVPKWAKKSMIHAEGSDVKIIADLMGYKDLSLFNKAMAETSDIDQVAKQMAQEYMQTEFGDVLTNQDAIKDLVAESLHAGDHQAEVLQKELEYLASNELATLKGLIRKIARKPPRSEIVAQKATVIISTKKISELQPIVYQRAEQKAAAEAADAFARGELEVAFDLKQKELLNHYLYKEAKRARELVDTKIKWSAKVFEGSTEDVAKRRDFNLVQLIRVMMGEYQITDRDIGSAYDYLAKVRDNDEDAYEAFKPLVDRWLVGSKNYREMKIDDFSEFMTDMEALWSLSRSNKEIEINGIKEDLDEVTQKLGDRLATITSKPYAPGETRAVTSADRGLDSFMSLKSSLQRVEAWIDIVDSGDKEKSFEKYLLNPVQEKVVLYKGKKKEILTKYKELVDSYAKNGGETKVENILASEINYTFRDKAELLAALLHTGNNSNLYKLLVGRKWGEVDENGNLDPMRWHRFIDRMHRENVITKADWDLVQGIWDLNESIKPDSQKAHKEMYGYYFNEVTHQSFKTPFGEYKGGYMPAITDSFMVEDSRIRKEQDLILNNNNSFMFPTTGRGFTKGRVEKYAAPLMLDINMVANHFDQVLRFTYVEPIIKKAARINNNKAYRAQLRAYDPYAGSNMLNPWLQRTAQQRVVKPSDSPVLKKFDGLAKFMRVSSGLQILGLSFSNAMQQTTGVVVANAKVKAKYLTKSFGDVMASPNQSKAEIMDLSPWMRTRLDEGAFKLNDEINKVLLSPSAYKEVTDFAKQNGLILSEMFQQKVDMVVWAGAYAQALDEGMHKDDAVKAADKAVRLTQGSPNAEDISTIEEGTHWSRLFTQFYGYFNMQANLLGSETQKAVRDLGWKKAIPKLLPVYFGAYLLPGFLAQLIAQGLAGKIDADDDDEIMDDMIWMMVSSSYKGAFAMVPMVGQVINMLLGQFTKEKYDDKLSLSPAFQQLENLGRTVYSGYKLASGDELKNNDIKNMLSTVGFVTGTPITPLAKSAGYILDVKDGVAQPTGPIDLARGVVTGKK